ncbi:hypothetical protein N7501_000013 [Penicillium viridicatum]|nr:hypothetical protein N7501_000013 [Penicillium viridicatum]
MSSDKYRTEIDFRDISPQDARLANEFFQHGAPGMGKIGSYMRRVVAFRRQLSIAVHICGWAARSRARVIEYPTSEHRQELAWIYKIEAASIRRLTWITVLNAIQASCGT